MKLCFKGKLLAEAWEVDPTVVERTNPNSRSFRQNSPAAVGSLDKRLQLKNQLSDGLSTATQSFC